MKITIKRKDVFDKVRSEVFYRGEVRRGENVEVAAIAQMSEDDSAVFGDFFEEAANDALGELLIWHYPSLEIDGDAVFDLCPPASWPMLEEELKSALENYIVHRVVGRWMNTIGIGVEDRTEADVIKIRRLLTKREKPL